MRNHNNQSLHVRDGLSQQNRLVPALNDSYFHINELSFEQLLTLARSYYSLMKFYDLNNEINGTWNAYLSNNEIVLLSGILSTDTVLLEKQFAIHLLGFPYNAKMLFPDELEKFGDPCLSSPLRLALYIEDWYVALRKLSNPMISDLTGLIEQVRIDLTDDYATLKALITHFRSLSHFESALPLLAQRIQPVSLPHDPHAYEQWSEKLHTCFNALVQSIITIQKRAKQLLPICFNSTNNEPSSALLIVFLKLFEKVQMRMNLLPRKRLDFYYQTILGDKCKALIPDTAHIVLTVQNSKSEIVIPKGTECVAQFIGVDYTYGTDRDWMINDCRVSYLKTYTKYQEFHTSIENQYETKSCTTLNETSPETAAISDICLIDLPLKIENTPENTQLSRAFPLFGVNRDFRKNRLAKSAEIGFACCSDILFLHEGSRTVTFTVEFETYLDSLQNEKDVPIKVKDVLSKEIETYCRRYYPEFFTKQKPGDNDKLILTEDSRSIFFRIFSSLFSISLTTSTGWVTIESYVPACSLVNDNVHENCLSLSFVLPPEFDSISKYDPIVHGYTYETSFPIMRCLLKSDSSFYGYELFENLAVRLITVDADIQGCRDLQIYNSLGKVSTTTPFMPFGPIPSLGSYFVVGCDETKTKELTQCSIEIQWVGLPNTNQSLSSWYEGYSRPVSRSRCACSVEVLSGGIWRTSDHDEKQELFKITENDSNEWSGSISFHSVIPYRQACKPDNFATELEYSPTARSGYFRCSLTGPEGAFGHQEYPSLLTKTILYNAHQKDLDRARTLPNAPYTPEIYSVTMNYRAKTVLQSSQIATNRGGMFESTFIHIYPDGWAHTTASKKTEVTLIPLFNYSGSLIIGLSASSKCSSVSLFFHLSNDSEPLPKENLHSPEWRYLSDNVWYPVPKHFVLSDTTDNCMKSGIIVLALPNDLNLGNTILPPDCYWVQLACDENISHYCRLYSIYPQGISATFTPRNPIEQGKPPVLTDDAKWGLRTMIPGISELRQIGNTFGGKPAESNLQQRIRLSERLSHKNRSILPIDYERIILEKFPEVLKVKCFPHIQKVANAIHAPGNLLIIPLPKMDAEERHLFTPTLSGSLIHEIRRYLESITSPFASFSVENPVFESIQVRGTVQLCEGYSNGTYLQKLFHDINGYISPWKDYGNIRHFGWEISKYEFELYLNQLEYVEKFTDFSMLRIIQRSNRSMHVDDSTDDSGQNSDSLFSASYPWSIAVPEEHHFIAITNKDSLDAPERAAISRLEIGSTFIIH